MAKIEVCLGDVAGRYYLRVWAQTREGEVVKFETGEEFSKSEADYRAISLSSRNGWDKDGLPTHQRVCVYPKKA